MKITSHLHVCILLPLFSAVGVAAPAIGIATATGPFTVDRANHRSNATLFEGNTFDSGSSEIELRLEGGTTIHLGAASRGEIHRDRVLLKDGSGDVRPGAGYKIEALNMRVTPMQPGAVARVVVDGGQLRVGALRGDLQVSNVRGVLLAKISQGDADSFTPQAGAGASTTTSTAASGTATGGAATSGAATSGAAAGTAAAGAAGGAATAAGVGAVAAGTATAAGVSTAVVVAGVAIAGAGAAAGLSVAATSGPGDTTLSPTAR